MLHFQRQVTTFYDRVDRSHGSAPLPKPHAPKPAAHGPAHAAAGHHAAQAHPVAPAAHQPPADQLDMDYARHAHQLTAHAEPHDPMMKAAIQAAARHLLLTHHPHDDEGKTLGHAAPKDAAGAERDRDFGHQAVDLGHLPGASAHGPSMYAVNTAAGKPQVVWADNGKRVTGAQWAAMGPGQHNRILGHMAREDRQAAREAMDQEAAAFQGPHAANPSIVSDGHGAHAAPNHADPGSAASALDDLSNLHGSSRVVIDTFKDHGGDIVKAGARYQKLVRGGMAMFKNAMTGAQTTVAHAPAAGAAPQKGLAPTSMEQHFPHAERYLGPVEVALGGLGVGMGLMNVAQDLKRLADGQGSTGEQLANLTGHVGDTTSSFVLTGVGATKVPGLMQRLGPKAGGYLTGLAQHPEASRLSQIGGVGLMATGVKDVLVNGQQMMNAPNFGNVLGTETGAMKTAAGAMIASKNPAAFAYGNALALTAGGLEGLKWCYDNNPTVKGTFDGATASTQPACFWLARQVGVIPPDVAAGKTTLPPRPEGGWSRYLATHSPEEVKAYMARPSAAARA